MTYTRGGSKKQKSFEWHYDVVQQRVVINNEDGRVHIYPAREIQNILRALHNRFGTECFPLANDVQKLPRISKRAHDGEQWGLGRVILGQEGANIAHAQGASYLGVVLERCGYFIWNNHHKGIAWRLSDTDFSMETIASRLSQHRNGLSLETKTVESAKILSNEVNRAVVKMPGRSFPGAVIQGDQLLQLLREVHVAYRIAKKEASPELQTAITTLHNSISDFYDNLQSVQESVEKQ